MNEDKIRYIQNWIKKSWSDLQTAKKLMSDEDPFFDTAIYHCQQAAEKALKGFLAFHDQEIDRTHDIETLVIAAARFNSQFNEFIDDGVLLTPYATAYRYPDEEWNEPDKDEMMAAFDAANKIFDFVWSTLPKSVHPKKS